MKLHKIIMISYKDLVVEWPIIHRRETVEQQEGKNVCTFKAVNVRVKISSLHGSNSFICFKKESVICGPNMQYICMHVHPPQYIYVYIVYI